MKTSKNYFRIMLGRKSVYAQEAHEAKCVGAGWFPEIDLTSKLTESWRDFNAAMIPVYLEKYPDKTKIAAGLACGMLWTIAKGMQLGDVVLCPDGKGNYYTGEVIGAYEYHAGTSLPHRRSVQWYQEVIERPQMSQMLQNSCGSIGTVSQIAKYAEEIENLISGSQPPTIIATDETIEDPAMFALEKHLEDFLVQNWKQTVLGKKYDIYEEEGQLIGQQYPSDTGPIDILAISKDKKELLVVELKRGRVSDVVVGQIQRYMGYAQEELAEVGQTVKGAIIALEDDLRLHRALAVARNIDFYTYQVSFKLKKANGQA